MIRVTALWCVVSGLAWYSRKDWYVSLCGLILLMAVIEHPDAPKTIFGIQGLNFWNILLAIVLFAWFRARRRERLTWDMPRPVSLLLLVYLGVVIASFARMMLDRSYIYDSTASLVSEQLVNTVKWVIPGLLLFDGCNSRKRFHLAVCSLLGVYVFLALYVIKWMPLEMISGGEELEKRALKILVNEIGYHRVNMSMMLAGAGWAVFASRYLASDARIRFLIVCLWGVVAYAQALTGGRMGYVTWGAVGLTLCAIRGRALLAFVPVGAVAVWLVVPAAAERLMQGFDLKSSDYAAHADSRLGNPFAVDRDGADIDTITAGRTRIWPYVTERILEAPVFGYGGLAMRRTGLSTFLDTSLSEGFDHPHNAYLEMLLDNGIVGFVLVMPFYAVVMLSALRLYADSRSPVFIATGGITAAFTLSLLIAAMGSQTFYPREGAVGMWCAIGLLFRVWVERRRALDQASAEKKRGIGAVIDLDARLWSGAAETRR